MAASPEPVPEVVPYVPSKTTPPTKEQRDVMENDLIALGEGYISSMDNMTVLHEDPTINYKSCYYEDEKFGHVTVSKYTVMEDEPRLIDAFNEMSNDGVNHSEKISERMRVWTLEEIEAKRRVVAMRTLLPFMLSNRIMFSCEYRRENSRTGEIHVCQSARGNEYYYEKYKK